MENEQHNPPDHGAQQTEWIEFVNAAAPLGFPPAGAPNWVRVCCKMSDRRLAAEAARQWFASEGKRASRAAMARTQLRMFGEKD